jgi:hypothetical protein
MDASITPAVLDDSLPATDEARSVTSNSLLSLVADGPTSIEPTAALSSAARSCLQLQTPNNASPTSLDTFHFFPKLAPELRLKIWNNALPNSRIVEVEVCPNWFDEAYKWWASAESKQTPCGLLLANKESCCVYLKHYLPLFRYVPLDVKFIKHENDRDEMIDIIDVSDSRFPLCYFDPKIDMLYLGPFNPHPIDCDRFFTNDRTPFATGPLESLAAIPALRQLRHLGCQYGELDEVVNSYPVVDDYSKNFLLFPSLEEFIIGVGDVGWEAMNLQENIRLRKTKASGHIELEEILRDEWASSDDPEGPD